MGRNPMGAEGRTVKATLRISPQEKAMLTERFGSEGRGMRAILDQYKQGWANREVLTQALAEQLDVPREVLGPPGLSDTEMAWQAEVGASVPLMSDEEMAAALELDRVKQALPIGDEHRNVGGDLVDPERVLPIKTAHGDVHLVDHHDSYAVPPPDYDPPLPGTITAGLAPTPVVVGVEPAAAPHRHRKGQVVSTYWDMGTKKHTYACATDGCPVIL